MKADRFIIEGKDFKVNSGSIKLNYWDYSDGGCSLEVTWVDSFEELEDIFDNVDFEDITLGEDFHKFSYEYDTDNCIVKVLCPTAFLNEDILDCIDEDYENMNIDNI